jgi:tetratricopeptide (TPR) repeat protein
MPERVLAAIRARDAYVARVPEALDIGGGRARYAFEAAERYFVYGQLVDAKARYEALYRPRSCRDEVGYRAWERLIAIATVDGDVAGARALAEQSAGGDCGEGGGPGEPAPRGWAGYEAAASAMREAEGARPGAQRDAAFRRAAELYARALEQDPARAEAPEAALMGVHAWKQVGEYGQAMKMLDLFIREYGSEAVLARLEKGDPSAKPPTLPDERQYRETLRYLKAALDDRSTGHILMFDYAAAAEDYAALSENVRLAADDRRAAARNATILWTHLGDDVRAGKARAIFQRLGGSKREGFELELVILLSKAQRAAIGGGAASSDAANSTEMRARAASMGQATRELEAFVTGRGAAADAAESVSRGAFALAALARGRGDARAAARWCKATLVAWERTARDVTRREDPREVAECRDVAAFMKVPVGPATVAGAELTAGPLPAVP